MEKADTTTKTDDKIESEEESDEEEITAAKLFNEKIVKHAKIGQFAGAVVASI